MKKIDSFQPINIASGQAVTIKDVIDEVLKATNYEDAPLKYDLSKPTMIPKRMINISLANKLLDWKPNTSLKEGIKLTVNWYQKTFKSKYPEDLN